MNKEVDLSIPIEAIRSADFVYIIGNGGSASTANHFANDLVKQVGVRAISLCSNEAVVMAYANDNGYANVFTEQLKVFLAPADLLISISGSGTSMNIVKAIEYAKQMGVKTWSMPTMREAGMDMLQVEDYHLHLAHEIAREMRKGKA